MRYIYTLEYYSARKKDETMTSAAAWMQPKIIIPSEICQKDKYHMILYVESKYGTNEPIYKSETDSQIQRIDLWLPEGNREGERWGLGLIDANYYIWDR